jgi:sulfur-oxidizing protein SoxX
VALSGNVGPSLVGVGSRLTPAQIRLRIADITRVYPDSVMPTFHRTEGMVRVAPRFLGKPALTGQQVEDLVAWLSTLR